MVHISAVRSDLSRYGQKISPMSTNIYQIHTSRRTSFDSSKTICFRFSPTTILTSPSFCMGTQRWMNQPNTTNKQRGHQTSIGTHRFWYRRSHLVEIILQEILSKFLWLVQKIKMLSRSVLERISLAAIPASQTLTGFTLTVAKYWNVVSILILENIFYIQWSANSDERSKL